MSLVQLPYPFPVVTPLGEGLVLYVRDNGPMSNDTAAPQSATAAAAQKLAGAR